MGKLNEEILNKIFAEKLLPESERKLATAILVGRKPTELSDIVIRERTDDLIEEMFVYYGKNINDESAETMKRILPVELREYYSYLTVEEVCVGVKAALRGGFGEVSLRAVSIKLFQELVAKYFVSDRRKRILNVYQSQVPEMGVHHRILSQKEKDAFVLSELCKMFQKYCDEGARAIIFSSVHYDFLLQQGVTMPDYKMYLQDAAAAFNQKDKNESTISESINLVFRNNIRGEAKRIALQQLFQQLKESGKTLADYIKSSQEFNNVKTK